MPKYDEFKSMTMGKAYDIDGFYGAQCWDGYAKYCSFLEVPATHCYPSGYVKSIWEERKKNGILKSFDEVDVLQPGDVVVFKETPGWTPLSHVAMFDHDAGGGYGWFYGQNQGGYNGAFNTVKLPYAATYKTAFRLKDPVKKDEPKKDPVREIADAGSGAVHRLYNKHSGDHLYTKSVAEARKAQSAGWIYEGVAWSSPEKGAPVYRIYAPQSGLHHYTASAKERDYLISKGWKDEGISFMSGGSNPVYRMYNPNSGAHILTASIKEHDALTKAGWRCEGQDLKW